MHAAKNMSSTQTVNPGCQLPILVRLQLPTDHIEIRVCTSPKRDRKKTRQQSEEIANQYKNCDLANPCIEHIIPQTTILPIDYLPIYRDGLACSHCQYVCRSERWIKQHQREVHNIRIGRGRRSGPIGWSTTWCQCFFISAGQYYFTVQN